MTVLYEKMVSLNGRVFSSYYMNWLNFTDQIMNIITKGEKPEIETVPEDIP